MHIRKDDTVVVISGDDKGKKGKVLRVLTKKNRVVVQGINFVWKHLKKSQDRPKGDRLQKEAPMDVSNVLLWCESCSKGVKTGVKLQEGKKYRYCRKCEKIIEEKGK